MLFDKYPLKDLLETLEAESSKMSAEIRTTSQRQKFILALIHHIKQKYGELINERQ